MAIDVNAQVASQMDTVRGSITQALGQMDEVYENLETLFSGSYSPFIIPSSPDLPVTTITVSAEAPDNIEIQGELNAISIAAPASFKPSPAKVGIDGLSKEYLNWIPKLDDITKEEDKILGSYSSELINTMTAKLLTDIQSGGTGLSAAVETAIQDRHAQRDAQIYQDARDKIASLWSTPGFEIPESVMKAQRQDLNVKEANLKTDRSREILVDSFKMADANTKWAVEQGIVLESKLMEMFNSMADRIIKYVLGKAELSAAIFKNLVDAYQAEAQVLLSEKQIENEILKTELLAWTAKLDYYKTMAEVGMGKVDALIKKYGVDINKYTAEISLSEAKGRINLEQATRDAQNILYVWKASLEALQHNLTTSTDVTRIKAATAEGTAQVISNHVGSMANSVSAVLQLSLTETIPGA